MSLPSRRRSVALALSFLACGAGCQLTQPLLGLGASARARLSQRLDGLLLSRAAGLHVGIHLVDGQDGTVLYEHNAEQHFVPASTLKMFTAAAALYYLGPTYRFVTDVLTDETERGGKVLHHLFVRGTGDPSLADADLAALAANLRQQGVTQISGDIVVDDSAFDAVAWGKGWMWDDLPEGFSAPVGALGVHHNEVVVTLLPGPRPDTPARLAFAPNTAFVNLTSSVTTAPAGSAQTVRVQAGPPDSQGLVPGQTIALAGGLPQDEGGWTRRFAVKDGGLFAAALLREHLRGLRIEVTGGVRRAVTPPGAQLVATHQSRELTAALVDFMKASNNHGMECLLKRMGANTALAPGSFAGGVAAVRAFLAQHVGLEGGVLHNADGSGNSRYNLVTPLQLTALLRFMQQNFSSGPEFVASLPIGGQDGTLSTRFLSPALYGRVRAKTGTMTGVTSLAGYVELATHRTVVFSIMVDGLAGSVEPARRLQEEILLAVATH